MTAISRSCSPPIHGIDGAPPAAVFIRRHRAQIEAAGRALDRREPVDARCRARRHDLALPRALNLRAVGPEQKLVTNFTILLTAKTMHALFGPSRRKWIAL